MTTGPVEEDTCKGVGVLSFSLTPVSPLYRVGSNSSDPRSDDILVSGPEVSSNVTYRREVPLRPRSGDPGGEWRRTKGDDSR